MKTSLIRYSGTHLKHRRMGRVFFTLLKPAVDRGWDVCLVLSHPPEDETWLDDIKQLGVVIEYLPRAKSNFDWGCVASVRKLCRKYECDIFHCDNIHTSPMMGAWLAGVPVRVWQKRSMTEAYEVGRELTFRDRLSMSIRTTCTLATRVVAVSEAVKQELLSLNIAEEKINVLINPFDMREFNKPRSRDVIREEYGYGGDDIVILTIGHAVPVKGWDVLIKAFSRVASRASNAKLLMVGDIDGAAEKSYFPKLVHLVDELGVGDKVVFPGHLTDISEVLRVGDIFVLPSMSEGFSNALLEGMGSGMPCVATRVGGAEDLIDNQENGFIVERGDADALGRVLSRLVEDDALREEIKGRSRLPDKIKTRKEYAEEFVEFYQSLYKKKLKAY